MSRVNFSNVAIRFFAMPTIFFFLMQSDAFAKKVYSPTIVTGEKAIELFVDRSSDSNASKDGATEYQLEFEFRPLDYWSIGLYGVWDKAAGSDDSKYNRAKLEVIRQLTEQGKYFLDLGVYFEYQKMDDLLGENDTYELKLLLEKDIGRTTITFNQAFEKSLTPDMNSPIVLSYATSVKYRYSKLLSPGIELYGDSGQLYNTRPLGEEKQYAGPAIYGKKGSVVYRFALLFGLNDLSDDLISSFIIEYEWF